MSTAEENINIPSSAFIPCPSKHFINVSVEKNCIGCKNFMGLTEVSEGEVHFVKKYRVNCGHPVTRQMIYVEID